MRHSEKNRIRKKSDSIGTYCERGPRYRYYIVAQEPNWHIALTCFVIFTMFLYKKTIFYSIFIIINVYSILESENCEIPEWALHSFSSGATIYNMKEVIARAATT
uniref:Uncharacterized protein n=1 Tax=Cacopsylla melanoneura TaxID=428564 RepID=A0A8D8XCG0_9HEMI